MRIVVAKYTRSGWLRRRLRSQDAGGAATVARLCLDQLNEDTAAVVDLAELCKQLGERALRLLGL